MQSDFHIPVLKDEVVNFLMTNPMGVYVDCTVGGGGHAQAILDSLAPSGKLIGLDVDQTAIDLATERLKPYGERVKLLKANFVDLDKCLQVKGIEHVDGVLFDLGVSSMQVNTPERGFSYLQNGPLNMRMDLSGEKSAWEVVNLYPEVELVRIFQEYGEERFSTTIARAVIRARGFKPIETTKQLVEIIKGVVPKRSSQKTLARIFQAIRIEVNHELDNLWVGLDKAIKSLKPGGRIGVITYHSLEDRIVKNIFFQKAKGCACPPGLPWCVCGREKELKLITRRPIRPSLQEVAVNKRARSAKLRVAERTGP